MTDGTQTAAVGRRFHLKELVGEGAFGEVYLAEQDSGAGFTRRVALKLLHGHLERSAEVGKRMRDEARILGRLQHKNIVTVLDLLRLEDRWAIVMDYVPGADLAEVIDELNERGESFPTAAAMEVGCAIFEALDFAFNFENTEGKPLHVVHRDIKPSNIRLSGDGQPKVLDFGVARVELEDREAMTKKPMWLGTERYMAPERIIRERDDQTGDVYAAAATIVELLLGEPFGRTPVLEDRHQAKVEETIERLRPQIEGPEALVEEVLTALAAALAYDPDARPTHREMETVLREGARKLEGEALHPFTRRVVPGIEAKQASLRRPVSGSLIAGTLAASGSGIFNAPGAGVLGSSGATSDPETETWNPERLPNSIGTGGASGASGASGGLTTEEYDQRSSGNGLVVGFAALGSLIVVLLAAALGVGTYAVLSGRSVDKGDSVVAADPPAEGSVGTAQTSPETKPVAPPVAASGEGEGADASADAEAQDAEVQEAEGPAEGSGESSEAAGSDAPPEPSEPATKPVSSGSADAASGTADASSGSEEAEAEAAPVANGPILRRAIVNLKDASSIEVQCGSVRATGTGTASIRSFPAGTCVVKATYLGTPLKTLVDITTPTEVNCSVTAGSLTCR